MNKQLRVLVVDDYPLLTAALARIFDRRMAVTITEATDGQHALDLLTNGQGSEPFHLIFVDWHMPRMTGIELLAKCKSLPELAHIPIIFISAERDKANIVRALKAGAVDYITKPIAEAELAIKVFAILNRINLSTVA